MKLKNSWLKNKKVLITGTSSGIGRDLCHVLINNYGCNIIRILIII